MTRRTNAQDALYVDTLTVDHLDQLTNAYTYNYQGNHDATYDANGNLTMTSISYGASIDSYFYDDENRLQYLVHSQSGQPLNWWNSPQSAYDRITHLTYDGLGRLRQRVEYAADEYGSSWSAGVETRYIYDGWRVIQERDGSNVPTVSYTRGTDLSGSLEGAGGIGGLLARSGWQSKLGGELPVRSVWQLDFQQRHAGGRELVSFQQQDDSRQQRPLLLRLPVV